MYYLKELTLVTSAIKTILKQYKLSNKGRNEVIKNMMFILIDNVKVEINCGFF